MRILITGASGFIGGFLVEEALRRGYETWAGVRSTSSRAHLCDGRIRFIDLRYDDPEALTAQIAEFAREHGAWDYVVHNAGLTKTLDKRAFFRVNAEHTRHLVDALSAAGCPPRKFILMSSLSAYGQGDERTFRPIRLDDPMRPDTAYGKSKMEAERIVRERAAFPYVILRPTGVYGPGERDYYLEMRSVKAGFDFLAGSLQTQGDPAVVDYHLMAHKFLLSFSTTSKQSEIFLAIPSGSRPSAFFRAWANSFLWTRKASSLANSSLVISPASLDSARRD